jgi:4-amino-4-deoxy-L-arabinose transferase-like glycosyltransferase
MRRLWPRDSLLALASTATVMLVPLTVLYTCHVNPDGLTLLWVTAAALLSIETAAGEASLGRGVALGCVLGAACVTKMSALPALLMAAYAYLVAARRTALRRQAAPLAMTAVGWLAAAGWWYGRNLWLYGTPFIHTTPLPGSALENALRPGAGFGFYAWLGIRETYLSTWAQRGWFPAGAGEWVLYGTVIAYTVGGVGGWLRGSAVTADQPPEEHARQDAAARILALLLAAIVVAQQGAYWLSDVGWNAGGRYVMMAMSSVAFLGTGGLWRLLPRPSLRVALGLWVVSLVAMNLLSAWNIVTVLNPRYFPGWRLFHLPPG